MRLIRLRGVLCRFVVRLRILIVIMIVRSFRSVL